MTEVKNKKKNLNKQEGKNKNKNKQKTTTKISQTPATSNLYVTAKYIYKLNSGVITTYLSLSSALILSRNLTSLLTPYRKISWTVFCTTKCQVLWEIDSLFSQAQLGERQKSKPFNQPVASRVLHELKFLSWNFSKKFRDFIEIPQDEANTATLK